MSSKLKWAAALCILMSAAGQNSQEEADRRVGSWKTWLISSGRDFRVPPPPGAAETLQELEWLKQFMGQADSAALEQVRIWNAGPVYRWMDILINRTVNGQSLSPFPVRAHTYVPIAMYDTMVAVWESKYFYNRARPSAVDESVHTRAAVPLSPSYPSEHAAIATAAAEVLAYLVPSESAAFRVTAEEAGRSRLLAGLEYPSDYLAGVELGKKVAAEVIARARTDGSDSVWDGQIPVGRCMWTGTNPGNVTAARWKPITMSSAGEFRPPPPPDCESEDVKSQTEVVRNYPRALTDPLNSLAFNSNWKAFYWQSPAGTSVWITQHLNRWILEDQLSTPRAARAHAAMAVSYFDAFIASQDGKFAYWYLRPAQLDSRIVPLFPAPNFPSYPSNHSTFSSSRASVLAHLFPDRADFILHQANEAGDSRIWAGIHYPMDNVAGVELGRRVAQRVIDLLGKDGSQ